MEYDLTNEMFRLATELVNQSSRNIFLTGKAGTGKTTFLKYIRENCPKQIAVVAPTGVAAINAGGVTMHSFFQLPFSPFIPDAGAFNRQTEEATNKNSLLSKLRMTTEKKRILQELELLIIDEISMVRCDMLDAVDAVLRHIRRRNNERFGGVQVLFIGDMFQLPPVIKEHDWRLLKDFYNSPYFFDSIVLKEELPVYIEFDKIYRQSEEKFINLLNQVRNNQLDNFGRNLLEKRFDPDFKRTKDDGYIILTTHNERARNKNETELNGLANKPFLYRAQIDGDFPESAYPAEEQLLLKVGSQVMFIKNDTDKIKRYFNGKIGIVTELDDNKILVQCKDEAEEIEVKKEKWENIRYSVDKKSRQLNEEVLGSFTQYPLRLAWAITIHKSQGLTFDKVIIDAGEAFAPGQVYVALSRCTTLHGIVLQSRIKTTKIFSDERIVQFSRTNSSKSILEQELQRSKRNYQFKILASLFDYKQVLEDTKELNRYVSENRSFFNKDSENWLDEVLNEISKLDGIAEKFQNQLRSIFHREENADISKLAKERMNAGAAYFIKEQNKLSQLLRDCPIVTDSRLHAKEINETIKEIFSGLSIKKYLMEGLSGEFDIEAYHKRKNDFMVPSFGLNVYAGEAKERTESPHPVLHQRLRALRDNICSKADLPIYIIAGTNTLDEMSRYLPQTLAEIRKISGFGDAKTEKYGQQFLDVILDYSGEKKLSSLIHEKDPKKEKKTGVGEKSKRIDTKAETFKLYKKGKRVGEISKERKLTQQTIEGHLAHYVSLGQININELVSQEKIFLIEPLTKEFEGGSITTVKEKLGNKVSFGEIRLVLAWKAFKKSLSFNNQL